MSAPQRCLRSCRPLQRALQTRYTPRDARSFSVTRRIQLQVEANKPSTEQVSKHDPSKPTTLSEQPDAAALKSFAADLSAQQSTSSSSSGSIARAATEPYVAYGATQALFAICSQPGSYTMPPLGANEQKPTTSKGEEIGIPVEDSDWYSVTQLTPTFNSWAQITFLHMWVLTVRLRAFGEGHAKYWHQNLIDHFFYAAEDRMATMHGVTTGGVRNRYLKDLHLQWRGCLAAYDEGFADSDAVLAAALWRNLFGAKEDIDPERLAAVVEWARKALSGVDRLTDEELAGGVLRFPQLKELLDQNRENSPSMSETL